MPRRADAGLDPDNVLATQDGPRRRTPPPPPFVSESGTASQEEKAQGQADRPNRRPAPERPPEMRSPPFARRRPDDNDDASPGDAAPPPAPVPAEVPPEVTARPPQPNQPAHDARLQPVLPAKLCSGTTAFERWFLQRLKFIAEQRDAIANRPLELADGILHSYACASMKAPIDLLAEMTLREKGILLAHVEEWTKMNGEPLGHTTVKPYFGGIQA